MHAIRNACVALGACAALCGAFAVSGPAAAAADQPPLPPAQARQIRTTSVAVHVVAMLSHLPQEVAVEAEAPRAGDLARLVDETLAAPGVALDGVRSLASIHDVVAAALAKGSPPQG
jgi:hypothetical protein